MPTGGNELRKRTGREYKEKPPSPNLLQEGENFSRGYQEPQSTGGDAGQQLGRVREKKQIALINRILQSSDASRSMEKQTGGGNADTVVPGPEGKSGDAGRKPGRVREKKQIDMINRILQSSGAGRSMEKQTGGDEVVPMEDRRNSAIPDLLQREVQSSSEQGLGGSTREDAKQPRPVIARIQETLRSSSGADTEVPNRDLQKERWQEQDERIAQIRSNLPNAVIRYSGQWWYRHLTDKGDGTAGISKQQAEEIIKKANGKITERDEGSYSMQYVNPNPEPDSVYRRGARAYINSIGFNTTDGKEIYIRHIGPSYG